MSEKPDESGVPEVVREAARAYSEPDDADLGVLSALHKGLHAVSSGADGALPWQRPPHAGEDGLATRHPR
ncbi:MAG TPA: hypothetical protein VGC04_01000 [Cellulomonas sp.]